MRNEKITEAPIRKFRVRLQSVPSPGLSFYDGYLDVMAESEEDARERVWLEVRRHFPDRARPYMWRIKGVSA